MSMNTDSLHQILLLRGESDAIAPLIQLLQPVLAEGSNPTLGLRGIYSFLELSIEDPDPFVEAMSVLTMYLRLCCLGSSSSTVRSLLAAQGTDWESMVRSGSVAPARSLITRLESGLLKRSAEWLSQTQAITRLSIKQHCPDAANPWDREPLFSWREDHPRLESNHFPELLKLVSGDD